MAYSNSMIKKASNRTDNLQTKADYGLENIYPSDLKNNF
jgi:hypothetical protein